MPVAVASSAPDPLEPYVEYVAFAAGTKPQDGVELMLTPAGVEYAKGKRGSLELARWLLQDDRWRGGRSLQNVADEISAHARFAHWPLLAKRANPVNIEYLQNWPLSLALAIPNRIRARLRR